MGNIREQSIIYLSAVHIEWAAATCRNMASDGGLSQSVKPSPLAR